LKDICEYIMLENLISMLDAFLAETF